MRLPSLKPREVLRALQRAGFQVDTISGSHYILRHPDGRRTLVAYHSRDLKRGTLAGILRQSGLTVEEFQRWL